MSNIIASGLPVPLTTPYIYYKIVSYENAKAHFCARHGEVSQKGLLLTLLMLGTIIANGS